MAAPTDTPPQRVALITIHGVGDPHIGDTAQSVAELLVAQAGYTHQGKDEWLIPVQAVYPDSSTAPRVAGANAYASAFSAARAGAGSVSDADPEHARGDLGLQLNYHLLRGTELPSADTLYQAPHHRLVKGSTQVDVVDMYWGDLSGLEGAVMRIVAELYTLIFHLCQLGRDTAHHTVVYIQKIAETSPRTSSIADVFGNAHQWADTLFTKPSGLLNALLVMVTAWWLGLAWLHEWVGANALGIGWLAIARSSFLVAASILLALGFYWRGVRGAGLFLAAGCAVAWALYLETHQNQSFAAMHCVALLWTTLLAAAYIWFLRFCDTIIHGLWRWGFGMGVVVLAVMLYGALRTAAPTANPWLGTWLMAALTATETIVLLMLLVWFCMGVSIMVLALAGAWLKWQSKSNVVTRGVDSGRFGLYISIVLFITLSFSAWALVVEPIKASFPAFQYTAFTQGLMGKPMLLASAFIQDRFQQSTLMFAPVVLVLSTLLACGLALLLPSLLVELSAPRHGLPGETVGRWLSDVGASFTWASSKVIFVSAFLFGAWAYFSLRPEPDVPAVCDSVCAVFSWFRQDSGQWLKAFTYLVAGSAASLLVVGGKVFGSLRNIRLALDAALDADRHFREFPDRATSRGRIAARMLSTLKTLDTMGYERIVICAHSQGSVIATELLRELQFRQPQLLRTPSLRLLSCGSPLRQIYAARFPALYEWVTQANSGGGTGPSAHALGLAQWTNLYCTGDYVGRWLWDRPQTHVLSLGLNFADAQHRQICLGQGAHTHYFDRQQSTVAQEIDQLLRA